MYLINSFDHITGNMTFKLNNGKTHKINIPTKFNDYRSVNYNYHYFDPRTNTIVIIQPPNNLRSCVTDNDGTLLTKATQYQFDKWMMEVYPETDNAKIYNILLNL
jgi:hypothetical protein